jgi:hypothetical protein
VAGPSGGRTTQTDQGVGSYIGSSSKSFLPVLLKITSGSVMHGACDSHTQEAASSLIRRHLLCSTHRRRATAVPLPMAQLQIDCQHAFSTCNMAALRRWHDLRSL